MRIHHLDRRLFLAGIGLAAAGGSFLPGRAEPAARAQDWPALQAVLDRYISERRYAGVAAALTYGDGPPAFLAAGTLSYESPVPVERDSLFRVYSITKPVTGIGAMLLIEDGSIALDQSVAEVLPTLREMRVATDPARSLASRPATRPITMRHLLTHTSGLSNWQPSVGGTAIARAYRDRGITPGSFVRQPGQPPNAPQAEGLAAMMARLPEVPLVAEPGTAWTYSLGLDVMGAVIERVSGKSLDAFMLERLFDPLAMRSTGFQVAARNAGRLTTLYGNSPEGPVALDTGPESRWLQPPTLPAGGGGLVSSARDFIRFGQMLLNLGVLDGVRVMKADTVRLAMSNLLPPGVAYSPTGGFGAGAGVVMPGVTSANGPVGTFSAVGASSTMFTVDPLRRGAAVFLAQYMPGPGVPMAEATRFRREFNAAADQDLRQRQNG